MEYGLCCLFKEEDIKFKALTLTKARENGIEYIEKIYQHNIKQLARALEYCHNNRIGSYRVSSDILPKFGTLLREEIITREFLQGFLDRLLTIEQYDLTLSFHPSQFVNMGSPRDEVVQNSIDDIRDHLLLSKYLRVGEINIHIGGSYGDKEGAKKRFVKNMLSSFSRDELDLITIENDELNYSFDETLKVCKELGVRLTYDIHHERCFRIGEEIDEERLFLEARKTWENYDYQRLHISSPRDGYITRSKSRPHHDYIAVGDVPKWLIKYPDIHIDIEAKNKEVAIKKLKEELRW
jgi:UV DNA damage endonuclease